MDLFCVVLIPICVIAITSAIFLAYLLKKAHKKPRPTLTMTAEDILHDLSRGPAIIRVERLDRDNLILRSPRDAH